VKPKDARLVAGSDVTITCSARDASLSWRRVGVATLPEHVTSEGGKLRLQGVRRSDAGLYVCTATSSDRSQTIDTVIRIDVTGDLVLIICRHIARLLVNAYSVFVALFTFACGN